MILNNLNFKQHICNITLFSSLTFMCSPISMAGIYKWTDAEGNVHYGQQRPTDTSSEKMQVPQHTPVNKSTYMRPGQKSADAKAGSEPDDAANKKTDKPEEVKETKAEKKQRLADCEKVRKNLATMKSNGRIRSKDKDGNIRYLSDEEKQARMNKSNKTLEKHCK